MLEAKGYTGIEQNYSLLSKSFRIRNRKQLMSSSSISSIPQDWLFHPTSSKLQINYIIYKDRSHLEHDYNYKT